MAIKNQIINFSLHITLILAKNKTIEVLSIGINKFTHLSFTIVNKLLNGIESPHLQWFSVDKSTFLLTRLPQPLSLISWNFKFLTFILKYSNFPIVHNISTIPWRWRFPRLNYPILENVNIYKWPLVTATKRSRFHIIAHVSNRGHQFYFRILDGEIQEFQNTYKQACVAWSEKVVIYNSFTFTKKKIDLMLYTTHT